MTPGVMKECVHDMALTRINEQHSCGWVYDFAHICAARPCDAAECPMLIDTQWTSPTMLYQDPA